MSYYTITINSLKRNNFDFGLDDYPLYDENHRDELNDMILTHYLMREIGFETAELFKIYLNQKMREIMPRYNIMFKAQYEVIDKLYSNVDLMETRDNTLERNINDNTINQGTTNVDTTANSGMKELFQDTPQGRLKSLDLENQEYATNLTLRNNNNHSLATTGIDTSTINTTNEDSVSKYIRRLVGNNGNKYPIELLNNVKYSISNIDELIIKDLDELFMQIY